MSILEKYKVKKYKVTDNLFGIERYFHIVDEALEFIKESMPFHKPMNKKMIGDSLRKDGSAVVQEIKSEHTFSKEMVIIVNEIEEEIEPEGEQKNEH
jgi:hypothetical protein